MRNWTFFDVKIKIIALARDLSLVSRIFILNTTKVLQYNMNLITVAFGIPYIFSLLTKYFVHYLVKGRKTYRLTYFNHFLTMSKIFLLKFNQNSSIQSYQIFSCFLYERNITGAIIFISSEFPAKLQPFVIIAHG